MDLIKILIYKLFLWKKNKSSSSLAWFIWYSYSYFTAKLLTKWELERCAIFLNLNEYRRYWSTFLLFKKTETVEIIRKLVFYSILSHNLHYFLLREKKKSVYMANLIDMKWMRIEFPIHNFNVFLTYYHYSYYIFAAWMITVFRNNNVRYATLYDYRERERERKRYQQHEPPTRTDKHISKL